MQDKSRITKCFYLEILTQKEIGVMPLNIVKVCGKCCSKVEPQDFVLATGVTASVREFVELAFNELNIEIKWKGSGVNEIG